MGKKDFRTISINAVWGFLFALFAALLTMGQVISYANNNSGPSGITSYIKIDKGDSNPVLIYKGSNPDLGVFTMGSISGITYDKDSNTLTIKNINRPKWGIETDEMGVDFKIRVLGTCALNYIYIQGGVDNWGAGLYLTGSGTLTVNENKTANNGIYIEAEYTHAYFRQGTGMTLNSYGKSTSIYSNDNKPVNVNNTLCENAIVLPDTSLKMRKKTSSVSMNETKDVISFEDARVKLLQITTVSGTDVPNVYAYPTSYVDGVQLYTLYTLYNDSVLGKCAKPDEKLVNVNLAEEGYAVKYDVYDKKVYTTDAYVRLDCKKKTTFDVYKNNSTGVLAYFKYWDNKYYSASLVESSYGTYAEVTTVSDISAYTPVGETYTVYTYVTQDISISVAHEHTVVSVAEVPATCTSAGTTAGTMCSVCGETITGMETIPMLEHDHDVTTVTKKASPTERGTIEKKCSKCGGDVEVTEIKKPSRLMLSAYTVYADENGTYTRPTVTVSDESGNTIASTYYSTSYTDVSLSTGKVTVTLKGDLYTGSLEKTFTIVGLDTKPEITVTARSEEIDASWNKLPGATRYRVFTYIGGQYTKKGETTDKSFTITGLNNGVKTGVYVIAYINGKWYNSDKSHIKYATPTGEGTKPTPVLTAGNGKIIANWDAISNAKGYRVFTYAGGKYTLKATTSKTTCTVTGLNNGTLYGIYVIAYIDGAWKTSDKSYIRYATPTASVTETKPTPVLTAGTKKISVQWNPLGGATNYRVYIYSGGKYTLKGETSFNSFTVKSLSSGTEYGIYVLAYINGTWKASDKAHIRYATVL